jgi:hypothetical protein
MTMMVVITIIIMGHECIWDTVWGKVNRRRGGRILKSKEDGSTLHIYI